MKLSLKQCHSLILPLVEGYYKLQETLVYFHSIKIANEKRDLYEEIIKCSSPFLDFNNIENNIKVLNDMVFSKNIKAVKVKIAHTVEEIKNLHSEGFELLNLSIPFNENELKKAYRNAARKHHPDVGGNEENMKTLNQAFALYNEFLYWEKMDKLGTESKADSIKIDNAEKFYAELFGLLFQIHIDIWELEIAKKILDILIDSDFFNTNICSNYSYGTDICSQLKALANKFSITKNFSEVEQVLNQLNKVRTKSSSLMCIYASDHIKKILRGEKKPRIIINHILQVKNAYRLNILSDKRYEAYMKKFDDRSSNYIKLEKLLEEFLSKNTFIKLPYDEKLKYSHLKEYVKHTNYFDNKDINVLSKEQQSEYCFTFYLEPSVPLINKYLFVRFCSYIMSIDTYEAKLKYLPTIIGECKLFENFFKDDRYKSQSLHKHIRKVILDLEELLQVDEAIYENKYKEIYAIYNQFLPIVTREIKIVFNP